MQYIMNAVTTNSLVIIDELARSTSFEDGTALALAIIEEFAQMSTFVYVTTHYTLLTKLYDMYPNVKLWQLETIPNTTDPDTYELDYKYNLIPGVTTLRRYGVYIVRGIWPDTIMQYVNHCLARLSGNVRKLSSYKLDEVCRLKYQIEADFRKNKALHKLTIEEINQRLKKYQKDLAKLGHFLNVQPVRKENVESITEGDMHQISEVPNRFMDTCLEIQRAIDAISPEPMGFDQNTPRDGHFLTPDPMNLNQCNVITPELPNAFHGVHNSCSIQDNLSDSSNYRNISNFLAETPENIYKLFPEVQLSHNFSSTSSNSFRLMDPKQTQQTLLTTTENLFSTPLNISNISNQVPANHTIKIGGQNIHDDIDLESIQTDLDIFSQIVSEGDIFEGESAKSNNESNVMRYISPNVIIHEGPDNQSLSFGETDPSFKDFQANVQSPLWNPQNKTPSRNIFNQNDVPSDMGAYRRICDDEILIRSPGVDVFGGHGTIINHHDEIGANIDPTRNSPLFERTDPVEYITTSKVLSKSGDLKSVSPCRSSNSSTNTEHGNGSTPRKSTYTSKLRNLERNSSSTSSQNMNDVNHDRVTDIDTGVCKDLDYKRADQEQIEDLDDLTDAVNKLEYEEYRRNIGTNHEEQTETKTRRTSLLNHSEPNRDFPSSRNLNKSSPNASSLIMYDSNLEERIETQTRDRTLSNPEGDTNLIESIHFENLHISSQLSISDTTNKAEIEQPFKIKPKEKNNRTIIFSRPKKNPSLRDPQKHKKKRFGTAPKEKSNSSLDHPQPEEYQSVLKSSTRNLSDTTNDNKPEETLAAKTIENNCSMPQDDPSLINPMNVETLNSSTRYTTSDVINKAEIENQTQLKSEDKSYFSKIVTRPIKNRSLMDAGRPPQTILGIATREISKYSLEPSKPEENQNLKVVTKQRNVDNSPKPKDNKDDEEIAAKNTEEKQSSLIYSKHDEYSALTDHLNSNILNNTDMEQRAEIDPDKQSHRSSMFSNPKKKLISKNAVKLKKKKKNLSKIKIMKKSQRSLNNAMLEENQSHIDASRLRNLDKSSPESDENILEQEKSIGTKAEENKTSSINASMSNKNDSLADASKFRNLDGSSHTSSSKNNSADREDEMQVKNSSSSEHQSPLLPENQDKQNYASLSDASKMRNLDNTASTSSTTGTNSKKLSTTVTSLSSVSKKRNLDGSEQNTTPSGTEKKTIRKRDQSSSADVDEHKTKKTSPSLNVPKKRKFNCVVWSNPDTTTTFETRNSSSNSKEDVPEKATNDAITEEKPSKSEEGNRKLHKQTLLKRFKPPRKLRAKEIREEYAKQDNLILQKAAETPDMNKYYKQLINRPSVKQYQKLKHLAYVVKTNDGVEVIPTVDTEIKKVKRNEDYSLFKRHYSNENVDMSIFSDKNAEPFEQYLNSTEKNYKNFSFSFEKHIEAQVQGSVGCSTYGGNMSTDTEFVFGIQNTFASTFVKKQEVELFKEENVFTTKNVFDETLTPDGFYKRNKEDITEIMKKYLPSAQTAGTVNMFEDDDISNEDLTL